MATYTLQSEDFYKSLDPILDEINIKRVRMDDDIKKKYVNIILKVVEIIIKEMRTADDVFDKLYSKLEYVGSYFDGLRVAKPTEFDLNLIMKITRDPKQILVENTDVAAGFVKINVSKVLSNQQQSEKVIKTIRKWCDDNGYLLENKVRQWMEGIISRQFGHGTRYIEIPSGQTVAVRFRKCGPAFTLNVDIGNDVIDVDLVFTIQFPETMRPPTPIRWSDNLVACWVVVPKPSDDPHFWRVSFSYSERKLTHNKNKLKLINRFLKALRDARDWPIASYFIKTLFIWEAHECMMYNRNRFWEKRHGYLFIHMLDKLSTMLNANKLPYYWHKKMNLFYKLSPSTATNMANQIKRIILKINEIIIKNDIVRLRNYVLAIFKVSEELAIADLSLDEKTENNEGQSCSIH